MAGLEYPKRGYRDLEPLPQQAGANGVLTFTFSSPVEKVWVRSKAFGSFASLSGPADGVGVPCDADVPTPLGVRTSVIQVWAPAGATVAVWGYR